MGLPSLRLCVFHTPSPLGDGWGDVIKKREPLPPNKNVFIYNLTY